MVVPVLMTSCQVSENPNMGRVMAQAATTPSASTNAVGEPAWRVAPPAKRSNACNTLACLPDVG
ncbi:hypothetical protein D9M71_805380 [compost metagenome]